jgi:hypothetical protein
VLGARDREVNSWPYRVVHKHGSFAIHRVYYDEQGEIWTCSDEPVYPEGVSLEDLDEDLKLYRAALDLQVLEHSKLVPEDESPSVDMPY